MKLSLRPQLELEWSRTLQWAFSQAKAEEALSQQKEKAEHQLFTATETLTHLEDEVQKLQLACNRKVIITELDELLAQQTVALTPVAREMEHFERSYNSLADELHGVMRQMPIQKVKFDEQELLKTLRASEMLMAEMVKQTEEAAEGVIGASKGVASLAAIVSQEKSELVQAGALLRSLSVMEIEERSLSAHSMQICEEIERRRKEAGRDPQSPLTRQLRGVKPSVVSPPAYVHDQYCPNGAEEEV